MKSDNNMPSSSIDVEKISKLLEGSFITIKTDKISIDQIFIIFRRRSYGGIFLCLGLLSLIPIISVFAGLFIIIPAMQMALGFKAPLLPKSLASKQVDLNKLKKINQKIIPWIKKFEIYVVPRWSFFTNPAAISIIGIMIVVLSLLIIVPLPLTNVFSAISIMCFALGLLEKDGLFILLAIILSCLSLIVGYFIIGATYKFLLG